jgi:hypothetical protein
VAACAPERVPAVVVAAPADEDSGEPVAAAPEGVVLEHSAWTVQGSAAGLQPLDGGGWLVEREDGAALELHAGWLVFQSLRLEGCEDEPTARRSAPPPHGPTTHPSMATSSVALDLVGLQPVSVEGGAFQALDVCEAGVGVFRADETTVGRPDSGVVDDLSLYVSGRLRRATGADWEPWEMFTGLSAEADLWIDPTGWDPANTSAHITLTVHPAHLLDGVALDQHPERVALSAVAPLLTTATVSLAPGSP